MLGYVQSRRDEHENTRLLGVGVVMVGIVLGNLCTLNFNLKLVVVFLLSQGGDPGAHLGFSSYLCHWSLA